MSELMARGTRPASGSTAPPVVRVTRDDDRARVHAAGALTLANAMAMAEALADAEPTLRGCRVVELDLGSAVFTCLFVLLGV